MTLGEARLAALVRMATGLLFLAAAYTKITGDFVRVGFAKSAQQMTADSWPFWRSFLESAVLPHAAMFAWVVALGELAVGIGLLLGLLTRVAAAGGVLLMLSILLGQSYAGPRASWDKWVTAGVTTKFALLLLLLILAAHTGRVWGLNGRFTPLRRRPRS